MYDYTVVSTWINTSLDMLLVQVYATEFKCFLNIIVGYHVVISSLLDGKTYIPALQVVGNRGFQVPSLWSVDRLQ